MNPSPENTGTAADEQASLWASRIEGHSLQSADLAALDAWLAQDPAHRPRLAQYCQFSAELEERLPALVAAGSVAMPSEKIPARRWHPKWIATAALAAAAVVGFAIWETRPSRLYEDFTTQAAERRTLTLADGTVVDLNSRTHLLVENGRDERRVLLSAGEAFFSVAKDKSRPFVVETPAGQVRVTGTKFDVRTDTPTDLEVMVAEGSVQVRPEKAGGVLSADPVQLHAGDRFTVGPQGGSFQPMSANEIEDALAWRQGDIVFFGAPLRSALDQFSRYDGCKMDVAPDVVTKTVGGRFKLDDLDGFLSGLKPENGYPVWVSRDATGAVHVTRRADP